MHLHDLISRIRKTEAELATEFKRKPTADEVAEVITLLSYLVGYLGPAFRPLHASQPAVRG